MHIFGAAFARTGVPMLHSTSADYAARLTASPSVPSCLVASAVFCSSRATSKRLTWAVMLCCHVHFSSLVPAAETGPRNLAAPRFVVVHCEAVQRLCHRHAAACEG